MLSYREPAIWHPRRSVRFYFTVNLPITQKTSPNYDHYYYYYDFTWIVGIKGNDLALSDASSFCALQIHCRIQVLMMWRCYGWLLMKRTRSRDVIPKILSPKPTDERIMIFKVNKWCIWAFYLLWFFLLLYTPAPHAVSFLLAEWTGDFRQSDVGLSSPRVHGF